MASFLKPSDFGRALACGPYTFPGCYPVYFITSDGAALSFAAAKKNGRRICQSIRDRSNDGWRVVGAEINWEDPALYCDDSGVLIEAAYEMQSGEPIKREANA